MLMWVVYYSVRRSNDFRNWYEEATKIFMHKENAEQFANEVGGMVRQITVDS